ESVRASQFHNGEKYFPVPPPTPLPPGWGRVPAIYPPISDKQQYIEPAGLPWDNSNSQYGLLGVWSAAETGIEVPNEYWNKVRSHWEACQRDTGEWDYNGKQQRGSFGMTVAGLASLFITHDYLEAPALGSATGRPAFSKAMAAGLAWLEKAHNSV